MFYLLAIVCSCDSHLSFFGDMISCKPLVDMAAVFLLILASIANTTINVILLKKIMNSLHFGFPILLTSFHFLMTYFVLFGMKIFGLFKVSQVIPSFEKWYMGFFGVLSIVAMNFNLKINSIGFYQLSKLSNIPIMVLWKFLVLQKSTPLPELGALSILLAGMCLFSVNDPQFNLIGTFIAAIAVISTAIYQTQTQELQKKHSISGTELNWQVAGPRYIIAVLTSVALEFTASTNSVLMFKWTLKVIGIICFNSLMAAMGNLIGFSLIGKAGPVSFQVIGHVKTIMIFVFGAIFFPAENKQSNEMFYKKIGGICVSMVGVILYTYLQTNKNVEDKAKENLEKTIKEVKNEEEIPLIEPPKEEEKFQEVP